MFPFFFKTYSTRGPLPPTRGPPDIRVFFLPVTKAVSALHPFFVSGFFAFSLLLFDRVINSLPFLLILKMKGRLLLVMFSDDVAF